MKQFLLFLAACLLPLSVVAEVRLPKIFADGMVLQQRQKVRLWGWCDRLATVVTSWDNRSYTATPDTDGRFDIAVETPQAGGPYSITFNETTGDGNTQHSTLNSQHSTLNAQRSTLNAQRSTLSIQCYIGEVWLCSGQSNMEMLMKGYKGQPVENAAEELLQCGDSLLRLFYVERVATLTPQRDVTGTWRAADADAVRNFSATAYFFGRALRRTLGVPVGLICTAFGGSACEAWMKPEWLKPFCAPYSSPVSGYTVALPNGEDDVKRLQQRCPTALYNGQLSPLVGYGIRGAIWYQGEDNVPRYDFYAPLLKAMVEGWRSEWQQGDFPFYYCQIAPFDYSATDWAKYNSALLREQQQKAESMIANARMAVLMDTGIKNVIHPRKKRQAGERLALLALANTYDVKGLPDFAVYSSVEFKGDTAVVAFDRSREWVYFEHCQRSSNFELAGDDRVFHPAEAWVSRNRVYVCSHEVKHPVAVRYAFHDWAVGDLMHDGLPVSSFRSDNW